MSIPVIAALTLIILAALSMPFLIHAVEKELEIFLFTLGLLAVTITGAWSAHLVIDAVKEPLAITLAVLITGLLFRRFKNQINAFVSHIEKKAGLKATIFLAVFLLSLLSSVITAIIAALVLCEIALTLRLSRRDTLRVIVMGCFGIGMGAILTPLGEPLSTIVVNKLSGAPHNAGFLYLFDVLWMYILPGAAAFAFFASRVKDAQIQQAGQMQNETSKLIFVRAAKVYLFVMALVFFGK
ncbi:MAG: DUF1646 domain-containing protein, partial [Elusimicrobiota bacterium]|nr:DUF1646 domain-containing protein [Elusimicrobiota bacterium]